MTLVEVTLPNLGANLNEATITKWYKQVGDSVSENDKLVEIKFDGKVSDVLSPFSGLLSKQIIPIYENISVAKPLAIIDTKSNSSLISSNEISNLIDRSQSRGYNYVTQEKSSSQKINRNFSASTYDLSNLIDRNTSIGTYTNEPIPKKEILVENAKEKKSIEQKPIEQNSTAKTVADLVEKSKVDVNSVKSNKADIPLESSIDGHIGYNIGTNSNKTKKTDSDKFRSDEAFLKKSVANLVERIKSKKTDNYDSGKNLNLLLNPNASNSKKEEKSNLEQQIQKSKKNVADLNLENTSLIDRNSSIGKDVSQQRSEPFDSKDVIDKVNAAKKAIVEENEKTYKPSPLNPALVTNLVDRNMSKGIEKMHKSNIERKAKKEKSITSKYEKSTGPKQKIVTKSPPIKQTQQINNSVEKKSVAKFEDLKQSNNKTSDFSDDLNTNKISKHQLIISSEIDVSNILNWQKSNKLNFQNRYNESLTFSPLIIELIIKAVGDYPKVNVKINNNKLAYNNSVNLAIAIAEDGENLNFHSIVNAESNNLVGLIKAIKNINAEKNINNAAIVFANVGKFKIEKLFPDLINDEAVLVTLGAITKKASVLETGAGDVIAVRNKMHLTITFNTKIIDVYNCNMFFKTVKNYIELFEIEKII